MPKENQIPGRESDLIEVIFHLIHINTEKGDWHRQWAAYHLMRATQGLHRYERGKLVSDRLHDAFNELIREEKTDAV